MVFRGRRGDGVVMGGHLLHLELMADESGVARVHSLQEMLILMNLLGASC